MSVFYDLASLVLVPSGYKSGKVYSQKPQTTDGQLDFTRASTATRVNASGLIESVATGVPRLDYLGSTCPKLLLEPQRTNLLTDSEDFNSWSLIGGGSVATNTAVAPDGATTADTVAPAGYARRIFTMAAGSNTYTVYFKAKDSNCVIRIGFLGSGDTALIDAQDTVTTGAWKRMTLTYTNATAPLGVFFNIQSGDDDIYAWGAQVEAGAYATSYIPTTTAAVTRVADACSKTGISSLIGQTEGTLFFECSNKALLVNSRYFNVSDGTVSNRIDIYQVSANQLGIFVGAGGAAQVNVQNVALPASGAFKFALAYANNDYVWYVNGTQIGTNTSASVPATSAALLGVGADLTPTPGNAPFKQALLFKTRLTNAQLAELTSL